MHPSARAQMAWCIENYMSKGQGYHVVDFGSRISDGQQSTHRDLLSGYDIRYTGVDIDAGRNVDVVMTQPYRIPMRSSTVDVVLTGQVFEHIPFFWASFLELARILRPGGQIFLTAPSRGHTHDVYDCWRYYPDSMRALAAMARLELRHGTTDFPPAGADGRRFDYTRLDVVNHYWGDTTGVFRKPMDYRDREVRLFREVAVRYANRVGDLSRVPGTDVRDRGRRVEPVDAPPRKPVPVTRRAARKLRRLVRQVPAR